MNLRLSGFWTGLASSILFYWVLRIYHGPVVPPTWLLIAASAIHVFVSGVLGVKVYDRHRRWLYGFLILAFLFPLIMYIASGVGE
ncbi:hypothetical protein [Variovorax sp. YR752]|uniref:hypothetical protein n=1 Tax=Variovorax sp. YR752 TaxID=1884383 RepID=UPI000BE4177D|nr:hypothetical protein [Variovorax sp. YR752]